MSMEHTYTCVWREHTGVVELPPIVWTRPIWVIRIDGVPAHCSPQLFSGAYATVLPSSDQCPLEFRFTDKNPERGHAEVAWQLAGTQQAKWKSSLERPLMAGYLPDLNVRILPAPAWTSRTVSVTVVWAEQS